MVTSYFITIEGIEGAGKSTASQWIESFFTKIGQPFILTREPGGTAIAEKIRQVVLAEAPAEKMLPETELLLMFAGRVQHIQQVVLPALEQGKWVICDRFVDASFAYQGHGRGIDIERIQWLNEWLVKDLQPICTILLDLPAEVGLSRAQGRGQPDRIEQETLLFHQRVRQGYLERASADLKRFRIINAAQDESFVQKALEQILNELLSS